MTKYSKKIFVLKKEEAGVIDLKFSVPGPSLDSRASDSVYISSDSYTVTSKVLFIPSHAAFDWSTLASAESMQKSALYQPNQQFTALSPI